MDASLAIRNRRHSSFVRVAALVASVVVAVGCGSDTTGLGSVPADQLFWALQLNWNAVNMALDTPYNTMQLTATPVTPAGAALSGAGIVKYTAADSSVSVDSAGRVTAHYVTGKTWVAASLTINGTTLTDTAFVRVTQHDPLAGPITKLSIQAEPGGLDSAKVALDRYFYINSFNGTVPAYVTMGSGTAATDTVCNVDGCPLLIAFFSSDSLIAGLGRLTGELTANTPGHVLFRASTWAYGVGLRDSLAFTIGYRIGLNFVRVYSGGSASQPVPILPYNGIVIAVGGNILVSNNTADSVEFVANYQTPKVHFQGSPGGTSIVARIKSGATFFPRIQFDSVGTYTYQITMLTSGASTTGTVTVSAGP